MNKKNKPTDPIIGPGLSIRNLQRFNEATLSLVTTCDLIMELIPKEVKHIFQERVDGVKEFYNTAENED